MTRRFSITPYLLAASMAVSLTACGSHKQDEPELTPMQQLDKLRSQPGVTVLKDGLAYKVLQSGKKDADQPRPGDVMMLIYEGRLPDGSILTAPNSTGTALICRCRLKALSKAGWKPCQ